MPKEREVTRVYRWKSFTSTPIGRPKNRWEDDVRKDLQTVKVKNWKKSVLNGDSWKTVVQWTKTQSCSVNQAEGIITVLACP
jgi:hypothetical protein